MESLPATTTPLIPARVRPSRRASSTAGKGQIGLAREGEVDERELTLERGAHRLLPVRAPEGDRGRRSRLFDEPGERERGEVLLEGGGEADERVLVPRDLLEARFEERADERPHPQEPRDVGVAEAPVATQDLVEIAGVGLGPVSVERFAEQPLAGKGRVRHLAAQPQVLLDADQLREGDVQVARLAGHVGALAVGLEEPRPSDGLSSAPRGMLISITLSARAFVVTIVSPSLVRLEVRA